MTLEATMLVLDNSNWMRNGDYTPSRVGAQADAVNLLFQAKQQSHPENTVGVMTMAGQEPEVLVTLTADIGKILNALHRVKLDGQPNLSTGIQIAQLALKYRRNRNQRQRIIAFVGSPVEEDEASLVKLAKKLKKNNVAVDIISFGETDTNHGKLEGFINNVNSGDNSHLVTIPPGPHLLSDALLSSPIVSGGGPGSSGGMGLGGRGGNDFEFGINPEDDPELAMALRISLQEEEARQAAAAAASAPTNTTATNEESAPAAPATATEDTMMHDLTEDEQIARAIAMSLENNQESDQADQSAFVDNILSGLTGANPSESSNQNNSTDKPEGNEENKSNEGSH
ncbi:hypothetical protein BDF22DRAFT_684629 [Syncephalis plumigaleata]|nr:hypothetical protein BDF22DRAFT_684629 [Syncephalis plumigaleata]